MSSLFTKIIAGEIPGQIVWQDDLHVALLTIEAIHEGHTKYTPVDGIAALKQSIVNKFQRDNELEYQADQIACPPDWRS